MIYITRKEDITPLKSRFLFGLFGGGKVYRYHFNDGSSFVPYAKGITSDELLVAWGCTDPTGAKWKDHMARVLETWSARGRRIAANNVYVNQDELKF